MISSDMISEFGGDESGGEEEVDAPEMKYVPLPVKTEMADVSEEDGGGDENYSDEQLVKNKKKGKKMKTPSSRRGESSEMLSTKEKQADDKRQKRAMQTPEEKEKAKEKERLRKQRARALEKTRREEEMGLRDLVAEDVKREEEEEDEEKKRRTPRRSAAKVVIKYEADSDEDEEEEEKKEKKKRSRKKKGGDDDEYKEETEKGRRRRSRSGEGGGGRRKRVSEMSEEEREAMKAKWREEARLKRARQRESLTPAEREAQLQKQREQKRQRRELAKLTKSEKEREEQNRKERERKKQKRALMTPEQKKEEVQKVTMRRIERLAAMTEDEKKMYRMSTYLQVMARQATLSEEEIQERKRRRQEYWQKRKEKMTEADKERMKIMQINRRRRIRQAKLSQKAENSQSEEQRDNRLMHQRLNRAKRGLRKRLEKKGASAEEIEMKVRDFEQNYQYRSRSGPIPGETEEEKRERIRRSKSLTQKKIKLRKKLEIQKLLESGISIEEINRQMETPIQRENRLLAKRLAKSKRELRKRLENMGASPSEIEKRVQEFEESYQPNYTFREYKPRPSKWKRVDPKELDLLLSQSPTTTPKITSTSTLSSSTTTSHSKPKLPPTANRPPAKRTLKFLNDTTPSSEPHSSQFHPQSTSSNNHTSYHHPQPFATPIYPSAHYHQNPQSTSTQNHYQVPSSTSSMSSSPQNHHPDYSNSYDPDTDTYSPPPSSPPGGGEDFGGEYSIENTFHHFIQPQNHHHFNQPPHYPTDYSSIATPTNKKPRKSRKKPPRDPSIPVKRRFGPRGATKSTKSAPTPQTVVCDECGKPYKFDYIREHKSQHHNPNYKNQTCLICGEKFTVARAWYTHFNRQHKKTGTEDLASKPHMCDDCGLSFKQKNNLNKHKYFMHGDGLKKENYKRCPVCPEEILFKENISLNAHLKRKHPEYRREAVDCYRCEGRFPNEQELGQHVKECHPDSYFPCEYCNACRFTRFGLNFHYYRCKKVDKRRIEEMKSKEEITSVDRAKLPCEFCGRNVAVFSLTRHYWEMHGVREEGFICPFCGKDFKSREFWAVHMEEKHEKSLEEMKELVRSLNVAEREGLEIRNRDGTWGGVPGNTKSKQEAEEKRRRRMETGSGRGRRGRRKGGGGCDRSFEEGRRGRRRRRRVVVVAEEDGENVEEEMRKCEESGKWGVVKMEVESESDKDEDDDSEEEEEDEEESSEEEEEDEEESSEEEEEA